MKIKEIVWIDKDSNEAALVISDGKHECLGFSHPCTLVVGDDICEPLQSLEESLIVQSAKQNVSILKHSGKDSWSHDVIAIVLDKSKNLIAVGGIKVTLNSLPGGIHDGDFVEFTVNRLDVIE